MTPGDSQITVERLREIIELTLESEEEIPEEIGIIVQELVEEVVRLQLRVADLFMHGICWSWSAPWASSPYWHFSLPLPQTR